MWSSAGAAELPRRVWENAMNKTIKLAVGVVLLVTGLVLAPAPAEAQDQAGIAGTIEDTAGLVLPGVTVTAESESLLAPRAGVSDGAGNYAIQQLPPGTYAVVFTLEGFGTVRREGIVLQGSFVADIDASLAVGGGGARLRRALGSLHRSAAPGILLSCGPRANASARSRVLDPLPQQLETVLHLGDVVVDGRATRQDVLCDFSW